MFWVIDHYNNEPTEYQSQPQQRPQQRSQQRAHKSYIYYKLNFEKIKKGCDDLWFGDTRVETNVTPRNMVIDESEPFHFVQLLYIIREKSWDDNTWLVFREDELIKWVKSDSKIYLENKKMFGPDFYYQFQTMIRHFINKYCDTYMRT